MQDNGRQSDSNTVRLAEHRIQSDAFRHLYAEGMTLVEDAAAYLDGDGRLAAKTLGRVGSTLYAAESMRLTTRLMQIASWLLLQRAVNSGEMTRDQVIGEKSKVKLDTASAGAQSPGWQQLPAEFVALVERSTTLQRIVQRMDAEIYGGAAVPEMQDEAGNPVGAQIDLLRTAFGG